MDNTMNAIEYLKEKHRMTNKCLINCTQCPLGYRNNKIKVECNRLEQEYTELAIEIVQKWAKEHPIKTILNDLLEKYPNTVLEVDIPRFCPSHLGYEKYNPNFCTASECRKCWNRPLEEKHG